MGHLFSNLCIRDYELSLFNPISEYQQLGEANVCGQQPRFNVRCPVIYIPWGEFQDELEVSCGLNMSIFDWIPNYHGCCPIICTMVPDGFSVAAIKTER